MIAYLATKVLEYCCWAIIFIAPLAAWIMTPAGMN